MDTKDYSRLLGYLQKILEYFIYVIFVILVIDWIVFRHMGYRHLDSIYSTFMTHIYWYFTPTYDEMC